MSTSNSPIKKLRAEALKVATTLKTATIAPGKDVISFAIVMDDKVIKIKMPKAQLDAYTLDELVEFIVVQMQRGAQDSIH